MSGAGLLQRPIRAVPTEDVGPLLLGGIGNESGSRGLHLRDSSVDLILRKIGRPEPDKQRADYRRESICSARRDRPEQPLRRPGLRFRPKNVPMPSMLVMRS